MNRNRIRFLDCSLDCLTLEETVKRCLFWIREDRLPHFTVGLNANVIILMKRDGKLKEAVCAGDLIQADGVAIVWTARLLGIPLPERVNGTDLMRRLIEEANRLNLRVFLLGSTENVLLRMVDIMLKTYPGVIIVGYRHGYFKRSEEAEVIQQIFGSRPDILFVGMPSPYKEVFSYANLKELNVPVVHGVGGSFDIFAGFIRRAPVVMQKAGLEWLWRLMMEPRKMWKRYTIGNVQFIFIIVCEWMRNRLSRVGPWWQGRC